MIHKNKQLYIQKGLLCKIKPEALKSHEHNKAEKDIPSDFYDCSCKMIVLKVPITFYFQT